MALHDYLRRTRANGGIAFDNATLLRNILPNPEPASVLLRTVALYALTYRENANANAIGGAVPTPEHLKLCSSYDCLFPFSNNGVSFPAPRNNDNIDLIIANNEFGVVVGAGTTAQDYIDFMNPPLQGARGVTALGVANGNNGPIPVNDENVTALDIHNLYNNYAVNHAIVPALNPIMNFFDEVNVVHYLQKVLARNNIVAVRELGGAGVGAAYDRILMINVSNQGPSATSRLNHSGNFEGGGAIIGSWGPHDNSAEERDSLLYLKDQLNGLGLPTNAHRELVKIFRDLYRLECIREPAALITNAMFVDLAHIGYDNVVLDGYNFNNIREQMPMAPGGVVAPARRLWRNIILAHNAINNHIYYRYDYPALAGAAGNFNDLTRTENNLLFDYIMAYADQAGGNITRRIENCLNAVRANQINELTNPVPVNPWAATVPGGNIYRNTFNVAGIGNFVFEVRFPPGRATVEHVFIQSFPLMLINDLLERWYRVDIGLAAAPNQNIQIDLQLRA